MQGESDISEYEQLRLRNIKENYEKMVELGLITAKNNTHEENGNIHQGKKFATRRKRTHQVKPTRRLTRQSFKIDSAGIIRYEDIPVIINGNVPVSGLTYNELYYNLCGAKEIDSSDESNDFIRTIHDKDSSDESNYDTDEDLWNSDEAQNNKNLKKRKGRQLSPGPNKRVRFSGPKTVLTPQEVTPEILDNITNSLSNKVYSSEDGTTCHQCRQKTLDQKTVCRSPTCFGVRGQFCGGCLLPRYGELVKDALLNPEWSCPVCRDICNCSICRNRRGLRPTGQLAPFAMSHGFRSVHHLLQKEEDEV